MNEIERQDAELIEMMENYPHAYLYAYNRLKSRYPEMEQFVFPHIYLQDKGVQVNYRTMFNCMLKALIELSEKCPYIELVTGIPRNKILNEYFIQNKEAYDMDKFRFIFFDDENPNHNVSMIYFSRFGETIKKRHSFLLKEGFLGVSESREK